MKFISKIQCEAEYTIAIYCSTEKNFFLYFTPKKIAIYKQAGDSLFIYKEIFVEYVITEVKQQEGWFYLSTEENTILEVTLNNFELQIVRKIKVVGKYKLLLVSSDLCLVNKRQIINIDTRDVLLKLDSDILQIESAGDLIYLIIDNLERTERMLCVYQYEIDHTLLKP